MSGLIANIGRTLLSGLKGVKAVGLAGGKGAQGAKGFRAAITAFKTNAGTAFKALPKSQQAAMIKTGYAAGGVAVGKGLAGA